MEIVRLSTYETNSSSCHSLIIPKESDFYFKDFKPDYDGYIHTEFGEFGWGIDTSFWSHAKLSYAVTMVAETEGYSNESEFYETAGMKAINDLFRNEIPGCNGVLVDNPNICLKTYTSYDGKMSTYVDHDGYIDHQSCEDYSSLQDFLDDWGISLGRFIFDQNIGLHIDNDNH